jgi:subtilisin family serine protease
MRLNRSLCWSGSLLLVALAACQDSSPTSPSERSASPAASPSLSKAKRTGSYLISLAETAPADVAAQIARKGGRLKKVSPEAGVAIVESDAANFAAQVRGLAGVEGVAQDRVLRWRDPNQLIRRHNGTSAAKAIGAVASIGDDEDFFSFQWSAIPLQAAKAWNRGARGTGARVAVLDGGLNNTHLDLDGNVDVSRSKSFVPGFAFNQDVDPDNFSHATHVAGIIAAQDDALGSIGIAPGSTIIGVKVLHEGSGSFEQIIRGIIYAATPIRKGGAGAHIINMSLGVTVEKPAHGSEDAQLLKALDKATRFARKQGVVVIAAAGNGDEEGNGLNHDVNRELVTVPAQSDKVLAVSATGPVNFFGGATNFDRLASYSNFGKSLVDFAGPGGDFVNFPAAGWFFDMILSPATLPPENDGYFFAAGTSMSAPQVAGVAALIVEKFGRRSDAQRVESQLRRSSNDLGRRGFDAVYGKGRVNAFRAVTVTGGDEDD